MVGHGVHIGDSLIKVDITELGKMQRREVRMKKGNRVSFHKGPPEGKVT